MSVRAPGRSTRAVAAALATILLVAACGGAPVATPRATVATTGPASPTACALTTDQTAELGQLARNGPASGTWVGVNLDWGAETADQLTQRLGRPPATLVSFLGFPLSSTDGTNFDSAVDQARRANAVLVVTLEPRDGLAAVTADAITTLTARLATAGKRGVPTIVRFAHEMNGSWYPWSQDPVVYVATFRRVADAVHAAAPTAAMLWAPNQGEGYPYRGGKYEAPRGTPASDALDTNHDGELSAADDPYAPYWPGESYVDWVGMSLYYWGRSYPWGANTVPLPNRFIELLSPSKSTLPAVPDFYADYAARYDKPLAIVETAAFYRPAGGGDAESAIKTAWLDEVFTAQTRTRFPLLRMVNWFEWRKFETEVNDVVDWRITADPKLRESFLRLTDAGFSLGPAVRTACSV